MVARSQHVSVVGLTIANAWVVLGSMSVAFLLESFVLVPVFVLTTVGATWYFCSSGWLGRRTAKATFGVGATAAWGAPFVLPLVLRSLGVADDSGGAATVVAVGSAASALATWHCCRAALRAAPPRAGQETERLRVAPGEVVDLGS